MPAEGITSFALLIPPEGITLGRRIVVDRRICTIPGGEEETVRPGEGMTLDRRCGPLMPAEGTRALLIPPEGITLGRRIVNDRRTPGEGMTLDRRRGGAEGITSSVLLIPPEGITLGRRIVVDPLSVIPRAKNTLDRRTLSATL